MVWGKSRGLPLFPGNFVVCNRLCLLGLVFKLCTSPCMMAEDGGLGVMHSATALLSVSLVRGMVRVLCLR